MKSDKVSAINAQLEKSLAEAVKPAQSQIDSLGTVLDEKVRDVINIYSNEMRNIAIISGTVAPFSLTLLTVEKLNVSYPMLLTGFTFLIVNIALAQYFAWTISQGKDRELGRTQVEWLLAQGDLWTVSDPNKDINERVMSNLKLNSKLSQIYSKIGSSTMSTEILGVRAKLRKFVALNVTLFVFGTLMICLSIYFESMYHMLSSLSTLMFELSA